MSYTVNVRCRENARLVLSFDKHLNINGIEHIMEKIDKQSQDTYIKDIKLKEQGNDKTVEIRYGATSKLAIAKQIVEVIFVLQDKHELYPRAYMVESVREEQHTA